jgi:hypothetical protein
MQAKLEENRGERFECGWVSSRSSWKKNTMKFGGLQHAAQGRKVHGARSTGHGAKPRKGLPTRALCAMRHALCRPYPPAIIGMKKTSAPSGTGVVAKFGREM